MIDQEKLRRTVIQVMDLLVRGEYEAIETLSQESSMPAEAMQRCVEEYPHGIVLPPEGSLDKLTDVVEVRGSAPTRYSVYVRLWDDDGTESDLALLLTLTAAPGDLYRFKVDDIRVI